MSISTCSFSSILFALAILATSCSTPGNPPVIMVTWPSFWMVLIIISGFGYVLEPRMAAFLILGGNLRGILESLAGTSVLFGATWGCSGMVDASLMFFLVFSCLLFYLWKFLNFIIICSYDFIIYISHPLPQLEN